jgi:hypothetical protein
MINKARIRPRPNQCSLRRMAYGVLRHSPPLLRHPVRASLTRKVLPVCYPFFVFSLSELRANDFRS